ncbi:MAG: tape measure protein [Leptospira sp.]|nr:tape measure protein [Leptospira sp.]
MTAGASVGSIYGQMILDTSQYEQALRSMVGLTSSGGKNMEKSIDGLGKRIDELEGKTEKGRKKVDEYAKAFGALGGILGAGAIVGGLRSLTTEAGKFETISTSFNVLTGSVEKGTKVLKDLNKYSLDTPFTPEQVFKAGRALTAFQITGDKLIPTMKAIGDISAGTGKEFTELATIYGKAKIAGTLYAEDINQLLEAGVPIMGEFAKQLGVSESAVKKMASEGKVNFAMLEKAFVSLTSAGGPFYEMTAQQAQTFEGLTSTLEGGAQELKRAFGEGLVEVLKPVVVGLSRVIDVVLKFKNENPNTFRAITLLTAGFAALVAILIGGAGLVTALGVVGSALSTFGISMTMALGPIGLVTAGIITLVGLYAQMKDGAINALREIQRESERLSQTNGKVSKATKDNLDAMVKSFENVRNSGTMATRIAFSNAFIENIKNASGLTKEFKDHLTQLAGSARDSESSFTALKTAIASLAVEENKRNPSRTGGSGGNTSPTNNEPEKPIKIDLNIDTGAFEGLKQSAIKAVPEISKYISEKLGVSIDGDLGKWFQTTGGQWTQGLMATVSKGIEVVMASINAKGALAQARLQNQTQNLNFWSSFANRQTDEQLKITNAGLDKEVEALEAQKQELLRIEQEYQAARDETKKSEIEKIKAQIEEEYNLQAQLLQDKFLQESERQETEMASEEVANANVETLQEDHLANINDLRSRFDQEKSDRIAALNDSMQSEDEARKSKQVNTEKSLVAQIAAIEKEKIANQEAADKKKKDMERDNARLQWVLGMNAFAIQKQSAIMQAKINMAMMIMDITKSAFSAIPFTLPILGFLPMAYTAGNMAIQAASTSQYPPPPATAFALGGRVEGGIPGKDSVPSMLMPGELVVPNKNFDEVVDSVASKRRINQEAIVMNFNFSEMNFHGVSDAESVAHEIKDIIFQEVRSAVAAL